jgi:hypothetical protein
MLEDPNQQISLDGFLADDADQPVPENKTEDKENIPLRTWIIGLSLPLLLACLCGGIVLLLAGTGYFVKTGQINLPLPFLNNSNPTSPQKVEAWGGASVEILGTQAALDKIYRLDDSIFWLADHTNEKYSDEEMNTVGKTLNYTVTLENSTVAGLATGWCARNYEYIKNNFADMEIKLTVDGKEVDTNHVAPWEFQNGGANGGLICERFDIVMDHWSAGEHTLVSKFVFKAKVNDGTSDFGPGEMTSVYKVIVKSAVQATLSSQK